jgi:DedD protein
MGLFSFLSKNKQDNSAEVSGHFSRAEDDAIAERARAKRASHAGGGGARRAGAGDPVLPEKKRARRRLVGAVALALAAAVGLPMLLDSEPKPLAGDIAIQIPAKDKAGPLPMPASPASSSVAASDSVDNGEEIVATPPAKPATAPAKPAAVPAVASERTVAEVQAKAEAPKPAPAERAKAEPVKAEPVKAEAARIEPAKPEHKDKPAKPEPKLDAKDKPAAKKDDKPVHAVAPEDSARAMAILEGKEAAKARDPAAAGQKFVLQVAALSSQERVAELQAKLRDAGIRSFTQKRPQGELIRVKVGPYSKEEAEKVRAQLSKLGLTGTLSPA